MTTSDNIFSEYIKIFEHLDNLSWTVTFGLGAVLGALLTAFSAILARHPKILNSTQEQYKNSSEFLTYTGSGLIILSLVIAIFTIAIYRIHRQLILMNIVLAEFENSNGTLQHTGYFSRRINDFRDKFYTPHGTCIFLGLFSLSSLLMGFFGTKAVYTKNIYLPLEVFQECGNAINLILYCLLIFLIFLSPYICSLFFKKLLYLLIDEQRNIAHQ